MIYAIICSRCASAATFKTSLQQPLRRPEQQHCRRYFLILSWPIESFSPRFWKSQTRRFYYNTGLRIYLYKCFNCRLKSSATVQHMHPLANLTFSAGHSGIAQLLRMSPSTPTSPNPFNTTAKRLPPGFCIRST